MSPAPGGPAGRPGPASPPGRADRLRRLLADRPHHEVADAETDRRAAVVLLLRPGGAGVEGTVPPDPPVPFSAEGRPPERSPAPGDGERDEPPRAALRFGSSPALASAFSDLETLLVLRVERDGDPWSGHVGLPGGHREPGDPDLSAAARRELAEEAGVELPPSAILGRLDDVHPRSRRLPSVAVTPYVAWTGRETAVEHGPEVDGHLWVPLSELEAPGRRAVLTFRRSGALRAFPAVEVGGLTVWGLTFVILRRFLDVLPRDREGSEAR